MTKKVIISILLAIIALAGTNEVFGKTEIEFYRLGERVIVADTVIIDTICHGEDYVNNGFSFINPDAGNHLDSLKLTAYDGSDSTVYLDLFVGETYHLEYYEYACQNDGYHGHGFDIDHPVVGMNVEQHSEISQYGCDSVVILKLTAYEVSTTEIEDEICYGENYYENGFTFQKPAVGEYEDSLILQSSAGCDSIVRLNLTVRPSYNYNYIDTICFGENYSEHGFRIIEPNVGMIKDSLIFTTKKGCDSILRLRLYVLPSYEYVFTESACAGETYNKHGFHYDNLSAGIINDTLFFETSCGCDSTFILELDVEQVQMTTFTESICHGESYDDHGFSYSNPHVGQILDTAHYTSVQGCDSTVVLDLYVAPTYTIQYDDQICYGENYNQHGFNIFSPAAGTRHDTMHLSTSYGCDSILILNLTVGDVYDSLITDVACNGGGYHKYGFDIDSLQSGTYRDTLFLSSVLGCDSTVRLELYVAPTYVTPLTDTICFGENYLENGFTIYEPQVGIETYQQHLTSAYGCDSLVELELYVGEYHNIEIPDTICYGESYNNHNFYLATPEVGTHVVSQELMTGAGCDSIVTLKLVVGQVNDTIITDTICYGESYEDNNFSYINPEPGRYFDTLYLQSENKCDSTVKLDLYVAPTYMFDVFDSICEGDDYLEHGLEIIQPSPGTTYHVSPLVSYFGCDSIYNVTLKVNHTFETPDTIRGENFVMVSNDFWTGKYEYSIDRVPGCKEYVWSLLVDGDEGPEENTDWILKPNDNICEVIATTPVETTLQVSLGNPCGDVVQTKLLKGTYFGIGENESEKMSLHPNPFSDFINIESRNIEVVNLYNISGQLVKSLTFNGEDRITLDLNNLDGSIYLLEVITPEGRYVRQVVKFN